MISLLILADEIGQKAMDFGDRALNSNKTLVVLGALCLGAGGFLLGVECVRAAL
jgi:hypothetical protein